MLESYYPPPWNINENQQKTEGWIEFQKAQAKEPEFYLCHLKLGWQLLTKDCWPPDDAKIVILCSFSGTFHSTIIKGENLNKNSIIRDHTYWILAPEEPQEKEMV